MAIASITEWLNNPNKSFHQGKALYEQYGDNRVLLALIKTGSTTYHFNRLRDGLEEVNKKSNLVPKPIVIGNLVQLPETIPNSYRPIEFANAPDKILQIRDQKNIRYAQARKLHETIRVLDSADLRLQAALELLDHMDFVNDSWSVIDEWKENGKIRELEKKETQDQIENSTLADLVQSSKNLPSYITKAKKELANAKTPAKQAKYAEKVQLLENKLIAVKEQLAKEFGK